MFSNTVEYALRAVVCLANHPDQAMTTQQIAKATSTPAGYLSKVLQALSRARIVRSRRGMYGGFTLNRSADQITMLDVINVVDSIKRIQPCPQSDGSSLCALHHRMDDAIAAIEMLLADSKISDLVGTRLCHAMGNSSAGAGNGASQLVDTDSR